MGDFGLTNSQRWYLLGRTSRRFLWCWLSFYCCSSFHFWSWFCCCSSFRFQATLSCHWHSTLASQTWEDCLFFFIYRKRYGFEWAFFTHRYFLPYTPFQNLWHNLLLSRSPWGLALLPWSLLGFILILKAQTRPICLFDSQ